MESYGRSMLKLLFLIIGIATAAGEDDDDPLTKVYKDMGIIPNYMDKIPDGYVKIVYDENIVLENGMELKPIQTKDPPKIEWTASLRTYYTIIMVCPDAHGPHDPTWRQWLHWQVVNIPATEISQGDLLCPYIPLVPLKTIGLIRFVFFIFQQTEYMIFDEPHLNDTSGLGRDYFDAMKFAKNYDLGYPIASLTISARWDESVDAVFEKMHLIP